MSLVDGRGRPLSSSAQPVITIVLEGRTLNFGANTHVIDALSHESKVKVLEVIRKLLLGTGT